MKKFFIVLFLLLSIISSNDYPSESTMITMKLESSKVLPNFQGQQHPRKFNHNVYTDEYMIKRDYKEASRHRIVQVSENTFRVVGSPASNWK